MHNLRILAILAALLLIPSPTLAEMDQTLQAPAISGGAFPEGEAGLSAYINTGQAVDIEKLKTIFSKVERVGDNYIVGVVPVPDWGGDIDVHLYADSDGWLVAFLKKDEPVSMAMQWGDASNLDNPSLGVMRSTTLEDALYKAGDAAAVGIVASRIGHYDFEFPNADRMMIAAKIQPEEGSSIFQLQMPEDYILFEAAYYHYIYYDSLQRYGDPVSWWDSLLTVDGTVISDAVTSCQGNDVQTFWRDLKQLRGTIVPGTLHTVDISYQKVDDRARDYGSAGVAVVLIYRAA